MQRSCNQVRPQITKSQNNLTVRRCGSTLSKEFLNEWVFLHGETVLQTLQITWGISMPCIVDLLLSRFGCLQCDVGQNILINFCNFLYLVFLCNFSYFRFRAFISLFFGVFNVVQSNQGFICFRSCLRISSYPRFFFLLFKRIVASKSNLVFLDYYQ